MHADVKFNSSPVKVLDYHEKKVKQGVAECIGAENYVKEHGALSYEDKLYPLELRAGYNGRVQNKLFHTCIQFGAATEISNEKMATVSREYLREMGFGDQPYL